jgi:curved DNA-binding protein CbpA
MTTLPDYYEVLQVSPNAEVEVIEAAHRRLAFKWHPDRRPGDPSASERMKLLNEAYEVLANLQTRQQYDSTRRQAAASRAAEEAAAKEAEQRIRAEQERRREEDRQRQEAERSRQEQERQQRAAKRQPCPGADESTASRPLGFGLLQSLGGLALIFYMLCLLILGANSTSLAPATVAALNCLLVGIIVIAMAFGCSLAYQHEPKQRVIV